jgi:drug/metabolite transporter (DMT)-like permease
MTNRHRMELLLLGAVWGASFLFMRMAVPEFGAIALVEIRIGIAALFLLGVLLWQNRERLREMVSLAKPLTLVGAINSALPFALFAFSTIHLTAGTAAVLNSSASLFGALVAYFWLHDRLTPARVAGILIGFAGVAILSWDKISLTSNGTTWAVLAALGASIAYGIAANYIKKRLGGVNPIVTATGSQIAAALLLVPLSVPSWPSVNPSLVSWLAAIALGIVCTGIAYILYFRLIAHVGPAKAITVTYLVPMFGILWGTLFLDEPVTARMIIACAVILLGTALATGTLKFAPAATATATDTPPERRASTEAGR